MAETKAFKELIKTNLYKNSRFKQVIFSKYATNLKVGSSFFFSCKYREFLYKKFAKGTLMEKGEDL